MRDIEQHHAVDAEAEHHGCRAGGGGRQSGAGEPDRAEHDDERQERRQRADGDQPQAAEHDEQQRQDHDERSDCVQNALALDDRFGFDRNAMPSGQLDAERWPWLLVWLALDVGFVLGCVWRSSRADVRWFASYQSTLRN